MEPFIVGKLGGDGLNVKSKEQPNRSERRNQNECDEGGKEGYFVQVFLIVRIIFRCILMKL